MNGAWHEVIVHSVFSEAGDFLGAPIGRDVPKHRSVVFLYGCTLGGHGKK
jgi:hypothetical protein